MDRDLPNNPKATRDMETKKNNMYGEIEEIYDRVQTKFNRFKNFGISSNNPFDHHYFSYRSNYRNISSWPIFSRRISQEWEYLEQNTPSSIFIRAYEQRINLMRAAIVGPPGTPYHHCLFFFDIIYPSDYPASPPKIYSQSDGIDLVTSLCSSSKVEEWSPEEYSILHVLESIQDRIFGSKSPDTAKSCLFFSSPKSEQVKYDEEMAFSLMCEKMNKILKRPPRDFEDFVPGYFRSRAHPILLKFKEKNYDSEAMIDLFVTMFKLFESTGAYCKHHLDFLKSHKNKSKQDLDSLVAQKTKSSEKNKAIVSSLQDHLFANCRLN